MKLDDLKARLRGTRLPVTSFGAVTGWTTHPVTDEAAQAITNLEALVGELGEAGRDIMPYLKWTIGPESPGYHPAMPSAVAAFAATLAKLEKARG